MSESDDREKLKRLEAELKSCLQAGEYLDALDLCEEIEALGLIQVPHWLAMATCLMGLRRKADAKRAWLKALELDPDQPEAVEGLNRNFPGWRLAATRRAVADPASVEQEAPAPPRPRPQATHAPSPAASARTQPPASPPPRAEERPRPDTAPTSVPPSARPAPPPRAATQPPPSVRPAPPRSAPVHASAPAASEVDINWEYVLQDVADSML